MRLVDCFVDLLAYILYFQKSAGQRQLPFEQVQGDVRGLLTASESCARKGGVSPDDYDAARFAVCAWVDEVVLSSPWQFRDRWQREQLQRIFYNTADAGEQFFDRLNELGFQHQDVREVYYLCMSLGFMGKYIHQGDEFLLEKVREANLKWLLGSSAGLPSLDRIDLFPEAYPQGQAQAAPAGSRWRMGLAAAAGLVFPVLLYGLLYGVYDTILNGALDAVLKAVP